MEVSPFSTGMDSSRDNESYFACDIPYKTQIGKGTLFPHHALGVVIHPHAVIGKIAR